jgi:hypothetical protein
MTRKAGDADPGCSTYWLRALPWMQWESRRVAHGVTVFTADGARNYILIS